MNAQMLKHGRSILRRAGALLGVLLLGLGALFFPSPSKPLGKLHTASAVAIPLVHEAVNPTVQRDPDVLRMRRGTALQSTPKRMSSRGTGLLDLASNPWQPFVATWYSPKGGVGDGMTTATGLKVKNDWTIAVDPNVIPLGSLVVIRFPDGHTHVYQAMDTGGAIVGSRVDIYNPSEEVCLQNGVQRVELQVIHRGQ